MTKRQNRSPRSTALFYAGEPVPAGIYRRVDIEHDVVLDQAGFLPASFDGRLTAYRPVESYWLGSPRRRTD
ncbi:MAG: hypothetical protein HYX94_09865 [Chloroflexi bacterium]|nr:hypothetical protein [Chloroflexota bacterium]